MALVGLLFILKLIWNALTPIELGRRALQSNDDSPSGISMAPLVEIGLLIFLIVLAAISKGTAWYNRPVQVALWGTIAILTSYALFVLLGVLTGWIVSKIKDRRPRNG